MKKVLVVRGGISSERDVSLNGGQVVAEALQKVGYTVVCHDLTEDTAALIRTLEREKPDVVFNALHGRGGEDGWLQGLLNLMRIPYTHSGVLASGIGMDKNMTRQLVQSIGIRIPKGALMTKEAFLAEEPERPYVIKPNNDGSSVGVSIVGSDVDKEQALASWPDGQERLVERYVPGRELSVAVLDGKALGIVEIVPKEGYYDFQNKYTAGAAEHLIPAPVAPDVARHACDWAEKVHNLLKCRGVSRTDFRLNDVADPKSPRLFFLEINTHPGMTNLSLVPDIARISAGIGYEELVSRLVEEAACDP